MRSVAIRWLRGRHDERGQTLVEIAIAVPIFMLIVLALFEGGAFAFTFTTMERATQDGGRFAALPDGPPERDIDGDTDVDEDDVKAYVMDRIDPATVTLDPTDITITVTGCPTSPCAYTTRATGERVRLVVTYEYNPLTANVFGSGTVFTLTATTEYMVE
jgi:Flp pilus assembly protein TadG